MFVPQIENKLCSISNVFFIDAFFWHKAPYRQATVSFFPSAMSVKVLVQSHAQSEAYCVDVPLETQWKKIMEDFAAQHNLPLGGLTFWVGDEKVCSEDLLSKCTSGSTGMVVVSADSRAQADLIALGDALRKRAEKDHSVKSFFEAVCGNDQTMTQKVFLRLGGLDVLAEEKNFGTPKSFFFIVHPISNHVQVLWGSWHGASRFRRSCFICGSRGCRASWDFATNEPAEKKAESSSRRERIGLGWLRKSRKKTIAWAWADEGRFPSRYLTRRGLPI